MRIPAVHPETGTPKAPHSAARRAGGGRAAGAAAPAHLLYSRVHGGGIEYLLISQEFCTFHNVCGSLRDGGRAICGGDRYPTLMGMPNGPGNCFCCPGQMPGIKCTQGRQGPPALVPAPLSFHEIRKYHKTPWK
eukprot:gene17819-biopygen3885